LPVDERILIRLINYGFRSGRPKNLRDPDPEHMLKHVYFCPDILNQFLSDFEPDPIVPEQKIANSVQPLPTYFKPRMLLNIISCSNTVFVCRKVDCEGSSRVFKF
jgi:hypothetical protein